MVLALAFSGSVSDKAVTKMILKGCVILCNQVVVEMRMLARRKFPEKTESIERFLRNFSYLEVSASAPFNPSPEQIPDNRDPSKRSRSKKVLHMMRLVVRIRNCYMRLLLLHDRLF